MYSKRIPLALGLMTAAMLASGASPDLQRVEQLVIERTNQLRRAEGRAKVEPHAKLYRAAQAFADFMARTDKYGHEADGRKPSDPGRRARLRLLRGIREHPLPVQLGRLRDRGARSSKTGRYYAVQLFGRPRAAGCGNS